MPNIEWAFFDLDGTLCRTHVIVHIGRQVGFEQAALDLVRQYPSERSNAEISALFASWLLGRHRRTLTAWLDSLDYVADIDQAVKSLNNAGIKCAISTATFEFAADHCASSFRFDDYQASELAYDSHGNCTGEVKRARESADKPRDLLSFCHQNDVDPERVVYVGDGASDIDVIRWCSQSIAFNSQCDDVRRAATTSIRSPSLLKVSAQILDWQDREVAQRDRAARGGGDRRSAASGVGYGQAEK